MAWGQAIAQTVGGAGNEYGRATDANINTALAVIQNKLMMQEVQQRLRESDQRMKEQDLRMKQMQSPQFQTFATPGQGLSGITVDPISGRPIGKPETIVPGTIIPKTIDQAWIEATTEENGGKNPTSAQIREHLESKRNPVDYWLDRGNAAAAAGNIEEAQQDYKLANMVAGSKKGPSSTTSLMSTISRANQGDPQAQKDFDTWMKSQKELAYARGQAFGQGRAMYQIGAYIDPTTGQMIPMSNLDAIQAIHNGQSLIPSGRLPANLAVSVEQLTSEATPALTETRRYLKAYDNPTDRAIFARLLSANPAVTPGQEQAWLGNILNQSLTENLSPEGKSLVIRLNRLNESVGRLRAVLGLPATQSMVAMTLAMVPGPTIPNSSYAKEVLDNLQATITNAVQIPTLGGIATPQQQKREVIDLTK